MDVAHSLRFIPQFN
ncbi:hypothetical protein DI392_11950 [Vibrio albus]|uniref:Uncharacterized protein n=1 Tax=Vibrio albus TaxID=2200953 RepID=A0A2U3B8R2_9VIBR|nr:hypothetical protein DI392_11950 [Vibrio albus]